MRHAPAITIIHWMGETTGNRDYCSEGIAALSEYHLFKRIMCLCISIVVVANIKNVIGAGEQLRALAAFPKDPDRIPRTHMGTHNSLSQQSQGNPQHLSDFRGYCIFEVHSSLFSGKRLIHIKIINNSNIQKYF